MSFKLLSLNKMRIEKINIEIDKLRSAANFANEKGIDRKWVYPLMSQDIIDYVEIEGTKFVYLNDKAKEYKKTRRI